MKGLIIGAVLWFVGIACCLLSITPWLGMWTLLTGVVLVVLGTLFMGGAVMKFVDEAIDAFFEVLS